MHQFGLLSERVGNCFHLLQKERMGGGGGTQKGSGSLRKGGGSNPGGNYTDNICSTFSKLSYTFLKALALIILLMTTFRLFS